MSPRPLRLVAVLLAVAVLPLTAGCADTARTALPQGVQVSVHQGRLDGQARRVQVRVSNDTDAPFTITGLSLSSAAFAESAHYPKVPATIRARDATNLPVLLGAPVCDGTDATPRVTVDFTTDAGSGHATVRPEDPLHQLAGVTDRDCLDAAIAEVAAIGPPAVLRTTVEAGRVVALIDLQVAPTGAAGRLTIDAVRDTPLLRLLDGSDPRPVSVLPLDVEVNGSDPPSVLTVPVIPARCDAHALAEDKQGTILPIDVRAGTRSGTSRLAMSETIKEALYAYIRDVCATR